MAIIILCRKCNGKGKIKAKIPWVKKTCAVCHGRGKMCWGSAKKDAQVTLDKIKK